MLSRTLAACSFVLISAVSSVSVAQVDEVGRALVMRLEMLEEAETPVVNGVEIASVDLLADVYSQLDFEPAWSDATRIGAWLNTIERASDERRG